MPTTSKYYPSLSSVVTLDDFPEYLGFIKEGLQQIFDKIYIKDFQAHISPRGESGFYGLSIVSKTRLEFKIPGTELAFVLNPDQADDTISSFPVTVEYQWLILAYLRSFDLNNFSFSARDFYELGLDILNISEEEVLQLIINKFVVPLNPSLSSLEQFVNDINSKLNLSIPVPTSDNKLQELVLSIKEQSADAASIVSFLTYLVDETDLQASLDNVKSFFKSLIPEDIDSYVKNIITPKARVTLALTAAIEFPVSVLKPVDQNGSEIPNTKTQFQFAQALLYADTQEGFGYQMELGGSLVPPDAEIGKTGLILGIESLKLDLSKTTNIAEANADGRSNDFVGIYARAIRVTLPSRWFHTPAPANTQKTTLRLGGYDVLIGTGGVSGTFMLETIPVINIGDTVYYFDDEVHFDYDSLVLLQQDIITHEFMEVKVNGLPELKEKLFPVPVAPPVVIPPFSYKFPVKLQDMTAGGIERSFENTKDLQVFLNGLPHLTHPNDESMLWLKIGDGGGFSVGFKKFDITLKQGVVTESNIEGKLRIPKLKNTAGGPADITISGHLQQDGDFNLTASEPAGIECNLFNVLKITLQSIELGKENGDFYIGADTKVAFPPGSFAASIFEDKEVDLPAMRFYANGRFELAGGTSFLPTSFTLSIGPIEMSVTGIHLGNIQREKNGITRTYNYIGFDGAMSVDPIGLDIRGSGVKFYYTTDCDKMVELHGGHEDDYKDSYVFISTLEVDLIIPGTAKPEEAVAIIKGSISIPEPGVSDEYAGTISLQLPKAKIYGEARLRLNPKYPAFLVEAEVQPPAPIPLGPIGINSFRGLLGLRYVAEKRAINMTDEHSWYDYYMAPERGIHTEKFSGPELTKEYDNPFSVGVGATFSSMEGGGRIASLRAMVLLSVPSLFAIDAGLNLLSERLGLAEDDPTTPPFYAFVVIADDALELGASAKFKLNKSKGYFLEINARVEAGFYFKNQKPWFVNFGTPQKPISAKLFKDVLNVNALAYLMISSGGIAAGANATFKFNFIIAKFTASVEVGGFISFERAQVGGYTILKGEIKIKFGIFKLTVRITVHLTVEMPRPFLIYAQFSIRICVKVFVGKVCATAKFTLKWKKNNDTAVRPIPPLTYQAVQEIDYPKAKQISNFVKGVNMLTFEEFGLTYLGVNRTSAPLETEILDIIPLDTYIDVKVEKGLNPMPLNGIIGGHTSGAKNNVDLIPPKKKIKNKTIRQFKHKYSIESIDIYAWNNTAWVPYHPFYAILPDNTMAANLKIGFWQRNGKQYDTLRLLATNPFSFLDGAEPGWFIPEQYGITPSELFCTSHTEEWHCANVLNVPLNTVYNLGGQFMDFDYSFDIDGALFVLGGSNFGEIGQLNGFGSLTVLDPPNPHGKAQSLVFRNSERLIITLPEPAAKVSLKITTNSQGATIKYYRAGINDASIFPAYEFIESVYKTAAELAVAVEFDNATNYDPLRNVFKIEIVPDFLEVELIHSLEDQIEALLVGDAENAPDGSTGTVMSPEDEILYNQLVAQLDHLKSIGCTSHANEPCDKDEKLCELVAELQQMYEKCFPLLPMQDMQKPCANLKCYDSFLKRIREFDKLFPEYFLIENHLSPLLSTYVSLLEKFPYWCKFNTEHYPERFEHYTDFRNVTAQIIDTIIELGDCNCNGDCEKDEILCELHSQLLSLYKDCFTVYPDSGHVYHYCGENECFKEFFELIGKFNDQHPEYHLISEHIPVLFDRYYAQMIKLADYCEKPVHQDVAFELYNEFLDTAMSMIDIIGEMGKCNCGGSPCQKIEVICDLYNTLSQIYSDCLIPLNVENIRDYCKEIDCIRQFINEIKGFTGPYNLVGEILHDQYSHMDELASALYNECQLHELTNAQILATYNQYLLYAQQTLTILAEFGNCNCTDGGVLDCTTSFQEVCWLTLEDYEYSQTIPSQEAVSEDMNAMVAGINATAQPIWRPNTKYYVKFRLKDEVDNGTRPENPFFDYYYGFRTVGPVGHFHKYPGAYPIEVPPGSNDVGVEQIAKQYPLTSISTYIDYQRSYPNADGDLILAKPLFFDKDQCKIDIYFAKPFAYHMVNNWKAYQGMPQLIGTMHLAIKDPISGSVIPYPLEPDVELEYVPTTILAEGDGWVSDDDPRMPHNIRMLSNFVDSVNANPDSIECDIHFGNAIKPASYTYSVTFEELRPRKLYTALVYNAFGPDNDNLVNEKIHEFVFQTSRYRNFREQVTSFILEDDSTGTVETKDAVYNLPLFLTQQQIDNAYALVTASNTPDTLALETQFYHPFDRVVEGVLGIKPIDPPTTTDFITVINQETGDTVAVIIRNPEPFNNPKIPLQEIKDTIFFHPKKSMIPDTHYKVLFSKDYSQMIVMHDTKKFSAVFLYIVFKYKIWNGSIYTVPSEGSDLDPMPEEEKIYTIKTTVRIK